MSNTSSTLWRKRLLWFVALWVAGVAALAIVAYSLRLFMQSLGLTV